MSPHYAMSPTPAATHSSVTQIRKEVKAAVTRRSVNLRGECANPRRKGITRDFDLVSVTADGLDFLPCTIWDDRATSIETRLQAAGRSLDEALTDGMVLQLTGSTWLGNDGRVCVRVTSVEPDFSRQGELFLADQRAFAALKAAGGDPNRLKTSYVHADPGTAFRDTGCKPARVMVLGPDDSQGLGDFKRRLGSSRNSCPETVSYRKLSMTGTGDIGALRALLHEAATESFDLVVLLRGGGHWSGLRGFERKDLALAIHNSAVPVATAVGHDANVSLADRAAALSFATPTAAAEAIRNELWLRHRTVQKTATLAAERKHDRLKAVQQAKDSARRTAAAGDKARTAAAITRELSLSRQEAHRWRESVHRTFTLHTHDLVECAEQRTRTFSQLASTAIVAGVGVLLLAGEPFLLLTTGATSALGHSLYVASVLAAGALALLRQRAARKKIAIPSAKPMKHPPADLESWRQSIKHVITIRGLRRLRHHQPR
jgi:exonuclease VII large subunit